MSETYEPYPLTPPPDRSVKVPHLVFALLFLGLAGTWGLVASGTVGAGSLPLIGPGLLIAAGLVGLVAGLASARNRRHRASQMTDQPSPYDDTEEIR